MVKDSTRVRLLGLRKKYGTKTAIAAAKEALRIYKGDKSFKQQFNGEICEVVLEMLLLDVCATRDDMFYVKGLVLPDAETLSEFLTEIDFMIATPRCVYCVECKSYAGDKRIVENGTIVVQNHDFCRDVFKQNKMHLEVLNKMIGAFSKSPRYQMLLFNFSTGSIIDERDERAKRIFPVVDETSIFERMNEDGLSDVWDYEGLLCAKEKLEKFSNKNRARHLKYVQGLHSEEERHE